MKKLLAIVLTALLLSSAAAIAEDGEDQSLIFANVGLSLNFEYNPNLWTGFATNESSEEQYGTAEAFLESSRIGVNGSAGIQLGPLGVGGELGIYAMGMQYNDSYYDNDWNVWIDLTYQRIFVDVSTRAIARLTLSDGKLVLQPHIGIWTSFERYQWDDDGDGIFGEEASENTSSYFVGEDEFIDMDPIAFADIGGKVILKSGAVETFLEVSVLLNKKDAEDIFGENYVTDHPQLADNATDIEPLPRFGFGLQVALF